MHLQNFTLGLRLETLALSSADVTIGCICCVIVMLSAVRHLCSVPHVSTNTHRGLATPFAYESCNNHRLLTPSFTTDLAICRQMCAADLSAVGGILTGESAATVPAPAVASVEDGLAASRASISLKMTNDEFARYLDVQMRSLAVWLLEHGHLSPTPASRSSLSSCKSSTPESKPMLCTTPYTTVS